MTIDEYPLDEIPLDHLDERYWRDADIYARAVERFPNVSPNYLRYLAMRESGGNPRARPIDPKTGRPLTSAYGTFQFLDSTAESVPADLLAEYGWNGWSRGGDWRSDPQLSAVAAAWLTDQNRTVLSGRLGRPPTDSELHLAHWAGPDQAYRLINADPSALGISFFDRDVIDANNSVFYGQRDTPKTVGDILRRFIVGEAPPTPPPPSPPPLTGAGVTAPPLRTSPRGQAGALPPPPRGGIRPPPQGNTPPRSGVGRVVADAIAAVTGEPPEGEGGMPLFGEPAPAPSVGFLKHPGKALPFEGFQMQPPPQLPPLRLVRTPYGWITGRGIGDLDEEMT